MIDRLREIWRALLAGEREACDVLTLPEVHAQY